MAIFVSIVPKARSPLVVALVYDGLCIFEFGIAHEIFGLERPEMGNNWYRFESAAIDRGALRSQGGFDIQPHRGSELIDQADIVIIPGWKGADVPVPEPLCARLRAAHARGATLASICSGAFVLAATGLLDGARITTHWRYAQNLREQYPALTVDEASLFTQHENIYTSAGSAAGIDLMIELVRSDFGPEAANSVARRIVMPAHRSGGQAQFLARAVPVRQSSSVAPIVERVRSSLEQDWSVGSMAMAANMSRRTFERRFVEATGTGPGEWLIGERVEAAKDLLSASDRPMEDIAAAVGFGSAHGLRQHFKRKVRLTPTQYRRAFSRS